MFALVPFAFVAAIQPLAADLSPSPAPAVWLISHKQAPVTAEESKAHEVWRSEDGLFYVTGLVNGKPVRFLVDTGASTIVLTAEDALRIGAAPAGSLPVAADTAAGKRMMSQVKLASMRVGSKAAASVPAVVAGEGLGVSLLGQNWLSHLDSVTIEGDRMILR